MWSSTTIQSIKAIMEYRMVKIGWICEDRTGKCVFYIKREELILYFLIYISFIYLIIEKMKKKPYCNAMTVKC